MKWEEVVAIGKELPDVEESPWYNTPSLKVRGKGFCRLKEDGRDVVFLTGTVDQQEHLIEHNPALYHITDHYRGWPAVLARLAKLKPAEARVRLTFGWRLKAPKTLVKQIDAASPLPRKRGGGVRGGGPANRARAQLRSPSTHPSPALPPLARRKGDLLMGFIVGIAGGSCAGKTTIARALAQITGGTLIAEDDYYICSTAIPGFDPASHDFDAPAAKDHALLATHLAAARRGEAFEKPLYDFTLHQRRNARETVSPRPVLILEGLHVFTSDLLKQAIDLKVYMEADEDLRVARRMERDVAARARTAESIEAQIRRSVLPGHARWVAPQKTSADLILTCTGDAGGAEAHAQTIAGAIEAAIRERLP
ncbi:MAG: MmcQ/YjbR family DNA-binding protein [Hyphomonadaceae bacterium]|nr:MmcQ/YjbR family DNA-binding protein [Hyphomonadaceae bacterium]